MLPEEICWRQKEQFSDGVGYNWIDTLKKMTEEKVSDAEFARRENRFPVNPPKTKEEYYYREIYSRLFPSDSAAKVVPHRRPPRSLLFARIVNGTALYHH